MTESNPQIANVAFVTGITGQDGSYLAELLLEKHYEVHGLIRRSSIEGGSNLENLKGIVDSLHLHHGDILDLACLVDVIKSIRPKEIYNLAAQSHVTLSFKIPEYTFQVNQLGCLNLLQAIIICGLEKKVKFYQASTSELFGGEAEGSLSETSPFTPQSPYAISKLAAYWLVRNFRSSYKLFAVNGIMFNHESPRRSRRFVTMRVAHAVAKYSLGLHSGPLCLAGIHMRRDWGHAEDYVRGMWLMLQQHAPDDFVCATGVAHSVQELVETAFAYIEVPLVWELTGGVPQAVSKASGEILVRVDKDLQRPSEVLTLTGNAAKASEELGWKSVLSFEDLISQMVASEVHRLTPKLEP